MLSVLESALRLFESEQPSDRLAHLLQTGCASSHYDTQSARLGGSCTSAGEIYRCCGCSHAWGECLFIFGSEGATDRAEEGGAELQWEYSVEMSCARQVLPEVGALPSPFFSCIGCIRHGTSCGGACSVRGSLQPRCLSWVRQAVLILKCLGSTF